MEDEISSDNELDEIVAAIDEGEKSNKGTTKSLHKQKLRQ
jgi:hypothetical protein